MKAESIQQVTTNIQQVSPQDNPLTGNSAWKGHVVTDCK